MKFSIVMAYHNRKKLLQRTLDKFETDYAGKYDFEVIIVDDNSNKRHEIDNILAGYSFPIELLKVITKRNQREIVNPGAIYNLGFRKAQGDIIIIQNPECIHEGDILGYTLKNLTKDNYISYACYAAHSPEVTQTLLDSEKSMYDLVFFDEYLRKTNKNEHDWTLLWYNYPLDLKDKYRLTVYDPRQKRDLKLSSEEVIKFDFGHSTGYHYCAAIYRTNLENIGGFSTDYYTGYCFDDDDLVMKVKYKEKLNIEIPNPFTEEVFVVHQYHKRNPSYGINENSKNKQTYTKWKKNEKAFYKNTQEYFLEIIKRLLEDKITTLDEVPLNSEKSCLQARLTENPDYSNSPKNQIYQPSNIKYFNSIPKIAFTYWDMSNLSFLHYLTLYTFKKFNPDWEVVLYYPKRRFIYNSWAGFENKKKYTSYNYVKELIKMDIKMVEIDFESGFEGIPFYLSEVTKSDFLRLKILTQAGGMWLDMDTFWINPIEKNTKSTPYDSYNDVRELAVTHNGGFGSKHKRATTFQVYDKSKFIFCNEHQDNSEKNVRHFCQYIIFSHPDSKIIKKLLESVWDNLNPDEYESIGTPMLNKVASKFMLEHDYDWDKSLINIDVFAPYKWHQMDILFESSMSADVVLRKVKHSCCIHWFNGSPHSKKFINKFNHTNFDIFKESDFMTIFNRYMRRRDKEFLKGVSND